MELLWCWRCKGKVPMLDEEEFRYVTSAHGVIRTENCAGEWKAFDEFPAQEYERITGFHVSRPGDIYHHRRSLYGPLCVKCDKPLRTPRATYCAACGHRVGHTMLEDVDISTAFAPMSLDPSLIEHLCQLHDLWSLFGP